MLKSIVVATDASAPSYRALVLAADMATKYDASLHILHVIRDMQLPDELRRMAEVEKLSGERSEVLRFVAEKILSNARQRAKELGVNDVSTVIGVGDPATVIVEQAKDLGADLILMGTRGLGQVKGTLLGSVSRKVSNLSEANLLIVK